jgi:hypothetical protein
VLIFSHTAAKRDEREAAMLKSKEHIDLMAQFEKLHSGKRLDREKNKELWAKGSVYENGDVNELFIAYRHGYSLAKAIYQREEVAA